MRQNPNPYSSDPPIFSDDLTLKIKEKALGVGFDDCGIAMAGAVSDREAGNLDSWIKNSYNAGMEFMERNRDKRRDPTLLVPGARSVVVLLANYYSGYNPSADNPRVARYAAGADYHKVLKDKLHLLLQFIKDAVPGSDGRVFTDSAPVMERTWAVTAGLGWIGRNSMLINRKIGSYSFIAEIVTTTVLTPDKPFITSHCGSCTKCIDACPTAAILPNRSVDSNRCISYATIEHKGAIPYLFRGKMENWIFGCDICQEVCPWNSRPLLTTEKSFYPGEGILKMESPGWNLSEPERFHSEFSDSSLMRAGYNGIKRNLDFINGS